MNSESDNGSESESDNGSDNDSIFDDESIDFESITNFDKSISKYKDFYKENVETIKLKFLYINKENALENIRYDDFIFNTPNLISYVDVIKILKSNNEIMNKLYKINSICLYNVSVDPENIQDIKEEDFLRIINNIDDIKVEPTINILNDLNELMFIFKEKEKTNNREKTRKVLIKNNNKSRKKQL